MEKPTWRTCPRFGSCSNAAVSSAHVSISRWKTASCGCIFNQYSAIPMFHVPAGYVIGPCNRDLAYSNVPLVHERLPDRPVTFSVHRYQNELPKKIKSRGKDAHLNHEELVQTMKWKQIVSGFLISSISIFFFLLGRQLTSCGSIFLYRRVKITVGCSFTLR